MEYVKKEIKKIVYNYFYGCYGRSDNMYRKYVTLTKDKITFNLEALGNSSIDNVNIKISYNTSKDFIYDVENNYKYDYEELTDKVNMLKSGEGQIMDAIGISAKIYYNNSTYIEYNNIFPNELTDEIERIISNYEPKELSLIEEYKNR